MTNIQRKLGIAYNQFIVIVRLEIQVLGCRCSKSFYYRSSLPYGKFLSGVYRPYYTLG